MYLSFNIGVTNAFFENDNLQELTYANAANGKHDPVDGKVTDEVKYTQYKHRENKRPLSSKQI
jgi:hypothetical protein